MQCIPLTCNILQHINRDLASFQEDALAPSFKAFIEASHLLLVALSEVVEFRQDRDLTVFGYFMDAKSRESAAKALAHMTELRNTENEIISLLDSEGKLLQHFHGAWVHFSNQSMYINAHLQLYIYIYKYQKIILKTHPSRKRIYIYIADVFMHIC